MTETPQQTIARLDKERRKREDALLLLLLGLMSTSRSHAVHAARIGAQPADAARMVIMGDRGGHFVGMPPVITAARLAAYKAGYASGAELVAEGAKGEAPSESDLSQAEESFRIQSEKYAADLADKIDVKIEAAQSKALGPAEEVAEIRRVFQAVQVTRKHYAQLATAVERIIVDGFGGGMKKAYADIGGKDLILRHYSILDNGTTDICEDRDMLTLYADDAYWDANTPQLHWGCRSVVLPAEPGAVLSNRYPTVPPSPGFGSGIFSAIGRSLKSA